MNNEGIQTNGLKYKEIDDLHLKDDIDRLYVSIKGGRELASIMDCVDATIQGHVTYTKRIKKD